MAEQWVLLEPVGSLGNRLAAIASARLLAQDLGRELVLDWRITPECCCPWERLVQPSYKIRLLRGHGRVPRPEKEPSPTDGLCWGTGTLQPSALRDEGEQDEEEPAVCAGAELLRLWGLVRKSANDADLLKQGLERLNSRHLTLFRQNRAQLLDVSGSKWQRLRRFDNTGAMYVALGVVEVECICVRAYDFFYPPRPKEREQVAVAKELSHRLRSLNFATEVKELVQELAPGSVGLFVPRSACNRATHAFAPVHLLELEMEAFSQRSIFLASDDPLVKEHFRGVYGGRLRVSFKRSLDRLQPEFVEDYLAELWTLGRADRLFGMTGCVDLRVASALSGKHLLPETVFYEEEDNFGEAEVSLADPIQPRGPFFLAGSWNDWKDFEQLLPSNKESDFTYTGCVAVRKAPGVEEFQILQNRDWDQRFYPSSTGAEILGPDKAHGSNWRVKVPTGCASLRILWDPRGARSFTWRFIGRSGWEWGEDGDEDTRLMRNSPYSIAGTWDSWKHFRDLVPTNVGEPTFNCKIRVRKAPGEEEFQVVKDRDWQQRFYPSASNLGAEIQGPDSKHGMNWQVAVPKDCCWIWLHWDPRGDRSVEWQFLNKNSDIMPSPVNRSGPFYLIGSWDEWDKMSMMVPLATSGKVVSATVAVRPDGNGTGFEEFLIVQERDWNQSLYPSFFNMRKVLGPDEKCKRGQYWRVRIRPQYRFLQVTLSPQARNVDWRFMGHDGAAVATERLRRSAPTEIENWRILGELGRGWAGGVVYKAKYALPTEEEDPGDAAAAAAVEAGATLGRLLARNPWLSDVDRAAVAGVNRSLCILAAIFGEMMRAVPAVAPDSGIDSRGSSPPGALLLQALFQGGLFELSELVELVAVHPSLCDVLLSSEVDASVGSRAALSSFCEAYAAAPLEVPRSGRDQDEATAPEHPAEDVCDGEAAPEHPAEEVCDGEAAPEHPAEDACDGEAAPEGPAEEACDGEASESEPRGDLDFLFEAMDEHMAQMEVEQEGSLERPGEADTGETGNVSAERQWLLYGIMHQGSFSRGSIAAVAASSRSAAFAVACGQGLLAQAAAAGQRFQVAKELRERPALGTVAAVKFPVPLQEIRMLKRLQGVQGVPELLDVGVGPESQFFCAMPLLGPSLDELLTRCNHDNLGGRMSWPVARALGARMVQVLRDIHRRGVVHCDIKPANVLVGLEDASVYIIDCGLSGCVGATYFKNVAGTLPYNSVQAGFPGLRTPADDLESVGWLLLRCVLGHLPWEKRSPGISHAEPELWRKRSVGMSLMKQYFLEDPGFFGDESDHCPAELLEYILGCQRLGVSGRADSSHLAQWHNSSERWSRFLCSVDASARHGEGSWKTRTLHMAMHDSLVWRSAPDAPSSERCLDVPPGLKVRTTGVGRLDPDGWEWLEVDPVFMPRNPLPFSEDSWLLRANERGALLVPGEYHTSGVRKMRT